jgi:sugar-specific transcriptional regulator TrmB
MDTSVEQEEIELAYVVRGKDHIIRRMKEMVGSAKREITLYISERELFDVLAPLIEDLGKRIQLRIALSDNLLVETEKHTFPDARHLPCDCSLVIVDEEVFLKISSWPREIAIVSRDNGLITMLNEYYEAPCCGN